MTKPAAALGGTGVAGTGAAALVGAHYMGAFGGWDNYIGVKKKQLTSYNGQCLNKTFGKNRWEIPGKVQPFGNSQTLKLDNSQDTKGCLAFNWDKWNTSKGNLGGNIRFVWSLARGKTGFVVYLSGTTEETQNKEVDMTFDGVAYSFREDKGKWKAANKLDLKQTKLTNDLLLSRFPCWVMCI